MYTPTHSLIVLVLAAASAAGQSSEDRTDAALAKKFSTYVVGDTLAVDGIEYCVLAWEWLEKVRLPECSVKRPMAMFLHLEITAHNTGKTPTHIAVDCIWKLGA